MEHPRRFDPEMPHSLLGRTLIDTPDGFPDLRFGASAQIASAGSGRGNGRARGGGGGRGRGSGSRGRSARGAVVSDTLQSRCRSRALLVSSCAGVALLPNSFLSLNSNSRMSHISLPTPRPQFLPLAIAVLSSLMLRSPVVLSDGPNGEERRATLPLLSADVHFLLPAACHYARDGRLLGAEFVGRVDDHDRARGGAAALVPTPPFQRALLGAAWLQLVGCLLGAMLSLPAARLPRLHTAAAFSFPLVTLCTW